MKKVRIAIQIGFHRGRQTGQDCHRLLVLVVAGVGKKQAAPRVHRVRLSLENLLKDRGCLWILLIFCVDARQAIERFGAMGTHIQRGLIFLRGNVELVRVEGRRGLAHGEPEARGGQPLDYRTVAKTVLLGLFEVADRCAKVVLPHAQEPHAGGSARIFFILVEHGLEAGFGFGQVVGIERGKGRLFGRRAGDAGVHFSKLAFVGFEALLELGVFGMRLEILFQLCGGSGIGRVPDQGLAQGVLRV